MAIPEYQQILNEYAINLKSELDKNFRSRRVSQDRLPALRLAEIHVDTLILLTANESSNGTPPEVLAAMIEATTTFISDSIDK